MADSYKNTNAPLRPGEVARPIELGKNNLSSMLQQGPAYIQYLQDSAPIRLENIFAVKTGVDADMALDAVKAVRPRQQSVRSQAQPVSDIYARGDVVYDTERGRKVTITKLNASQTTKGKPVHRVTSNSGDSWLQKESKLRPL